MRLIDADKALAEAKRISGPITGDGWDNYGVYALIERQPTVEAVPIKAISAWLAAYAAPPLYASDHVAALKNKVSIKTETERAEAWEYHWQHLIDCGLLQEDNHSETGDM